MFIHKGEGVGPSPNEKFPVPNSETVIFLKNIITKSNIIVGDYTTFSPLKSDNKDFENENVLYYSPIIGDKLIIGKFVQIASKVKFMMNGANHTHSNFSTYGFGFLGKGWHSDSEDINKQKVGYPTDHVIKGDTIIGNAVWLGYDSLIMPGVKIGDGAIVGARAVVTKNVEPFSIMAGNPAVKIAMRFDKETIKLLEQLKWWDLPIDVITEHLEIISGNDPDKLKRLIRKQE